MGELRSLGDGGWAGIREEVRAQIEASPLLRPAHGLPVEEHRARVMEQARMVSQTRSARLFFPREYGGGGGMGAGPGGPPVLSGLHLFPLRDECLAWRRHLSAVRSGALASTL